MKSYDNAYYNRGSNLFKFKKVINLLAIVFYLQFYSRCFYYEPVRHVLWKLLELGLGGRRLRLVLNK